jgi:hypothetical protein
MAKLLSVTALVLVATSSRAIAQELVAELAAQNPATFSELQKTVFTQSCTSCHMQMSANEPAEAGIDFMSYEAMMASNESTTNPKHAPFIIPGDPIHSKMYIAVKKGKMPATEDGSPGIPLSPQQIQNIYDWIKAGAKND